MLARDTQHKFDFEPEFIDRLPRFVAKNSKLMFQFSFLLFTSATVEFAFVFFQKKLHNIFCAIIRRPRSLRHCRSSKRQNSIASSIAGLNGILGKLGISLANDDFKPLSKLGDNRTKSRNIRHFPFLHHE